MTKQNEDAFSKYLEGVRPIKKKNNIKKTIKKTPKHLISVKNKIQNKEDREKKTKDNKVKKSNKYALEFGISNKKLRKGKIPIDKKIDLHGKTISQAENIFFETVYNNYYQNKRCLLFITGKGLVNKNKDTKEMFQGTPKLFYGKIRESFMRWVTKPELLKFILSVERASTKDGGDGAFYVYLRKKTSQPKY